MGQVATRSQFTVTLGSTVLLAANDLLYGDPSQLLRITPEFPVEAALFVGGGARMFERAKTNRMHTLEFTRVRIHDTVQAALRFQLAHFGDIPLGGQDLTVELEGYNGSATLHKAAVISAPIHTIHRLSICSYVIKGGDLVSNLSLSTNILDETGDNVLDEAGVNLQQNP